jgi:hypothetical protein
MAEDAKTSAAARRKAVERIGQQRRSAQSKTNRTTITQLQEDHRFRLKWKADVKEKRRDKLSAQVDQEILRKTIKNEPRLLDFSRTDDINPLRGLDLKLKEHPLQLEIVESNALDILIQTNKQTAADGRRSSVGDNGLQSADLHVGSVPNTNKGSSYPRENNSPINSALLTKFGKKPAAKSSLYSTEAERQLLLGSLSFDDGISGPKIMSRTNSIDLTQDVIHASLEAIAGKHGLADISDRLIDNIFVIGPQAGEVESLACQNQFQLGSDTSSVENRQMSPASSKSSVSNVGALITSGSEKIGGLKRVSTTKKLIDDKVEKLAPTLLYSLNPMEVEIEELCFPR